MTEIRSLTFISSYDETNYIKGPHMILRMTSLGLVSANEKLEDYLYPSRVIIR